MKLLLLLTVLVASQSPSNPFPNHEQPPKGWFCYTAGTQSNVENDAHSCSCRGMGHDPICPPLPSEPNVIHNPYEGCKVICHEDHCLCSNPCKNDSN